MTKSKNIKGRKPQWILNLGMVFSKVALLTAGAPKVKIVPVSSPEVGLAPVISLNLQSLAIKREGQVDWAVEGDVHCGPKAELRDGKIPVKYTVTVTCAPTLDERGFLFDQASVDLWMRRQASKVTKLSCEALVVETAKNMLLKLAKDVPHCKVIELVMTLSPSPFMAGVTCRFA